MAGFSASITCTAGSGVVVSGLLVLLWGHPAISDNMSFSIAVGVAEVLACPDMVVITLVTLGIGTHV